MTQPYGFLTRTGRNKEAANFLNGTPWEITHIALGDGDYALTGGETELQNEIGRHVIMAMGTTGEPNVLFFRTHIGMEDGPYPNIREAGLIDADGDLIAIVKYPDPMSKPLTFELTVSLLIAFSDLENLVIKVNPETSFVPGERRVDTASGLTGGGDLAQDRTIALDPGGLDAAGSLAAGDGLIGHDSSEDKPVRISLSQLEKFTARAGAARAFYMGQI